MPLVGFVGAVMAVTVMFLWGVVGVVRAGHAEYAQLLYAGYQLAVLALLIDLLLPVVIGLSGWLTAAYGWVIQLWQLI